MQSAQLKSYADVGKMLIDLEFIENAGRISESHSEKAKETLSAISEHGFRIGGFSSEGNFPSKHLRFFSFAHKPAWKKRSIHL